MKYTLETIGPLYTEALKNLDKGPNPYKATISSLNPDYNPETVSMLS